MNKTEFEELAAEVSNKANKMLYHEPLLQVGWVTPNFLQAPLSVEPCVISTEGGAALQGYLYSDENTLQPAWVKLL